jgi:hypothetical protein
MSIYIYKYTYIYPILMSTYKKLNRLNLEIHEVGRTLNIRPSTKKHSDN